jgi:Fe-S cluster biosynthesis and repair protein YggX
VEYNLNKYYYSKALKLDDKIDTDTGRTIAKIAYNYDNYWYLYYNNGSLNMLANGILLTGLDIPAGKIDEIDGFIGFFERTDVTAYPSLWKIYFRKDFNVYSFKLTDELFNLIGTKSMNEMVKDGTIVLPDKGRASIQNPEEGQMVREGTNIYVYLGGTWKQINML